MVSLSGSRFFHHHRNNNVFAATILFVIIGVVPSAVSAASPSICYYPDGSVAVKSVPCFPDGSSGQCCESTHVCLTNGLCFDTVFNHVIRVACTDPTWTSPSCPKYCVDEAPSGFGNLRQCPGANDFWICDMDTSKCSLSKNPSMFSNPKVGLVRDGRSSTLSQVYIPTDVPSSALSSSSPSSTSSSSTRSASAYTVTVTAAAKASTHTEAAVGAGVGVPLLFALAASLILLFRERKLRRNDARNRLAVRGTTHDHYHHHGVWTDQADDLHQLQRQMLSTTEPQEMSVARPLFQMDNDAACAAGRQM